MRSKEMGSRELSVFAEHTAVILEAGLPLGDGMETLAEAAAGESHAEQYEQLSRKVNESGSLSEALREDPRWPAYMTEMADIGERAGQLPRVMRGLSRYYAREDRVKRTIAAAVTYPLSLGVMLVVIVLIMLLRVLPVFRRVLASMGTGVGASGTAMIRLGTGLGWLVLVLVAVTLLAVLTISVLLRTKGHDKTVAFLIRHVPPVQRVLFRLSASRVADVLSMMLGSGFPLEEALSVTPDVLSDREAAEKVRGIHERLIAGDSFADALEQAQLFDGLQSRMVRVGIAAGREDIVMAEIAEQTQEEAEESISYLVSIIEPTLIALLSVVIGAILLSVMLPMAGILTAMM